MYDYPWPSCMLACSERGGALIAINVKDESPRMSFILKGSQVSAIQLKGWFKSKTRVNLRL